MKSDCLSLDLTMLHRTRFVARRCAFAALKGPDREAPGNALGIDGDLYEFALKGRHRPCSALTGQRKRRGNRDRSQFPRALPGAILFGPFRPRNPEASAQENRQEHETRPGLALDKPRAWGAGKIQRFRPPAHLPQVPSPRVPGYLASGTVSVLFASGAVSALFASGTFSARGGGTGLPSFSR
jgi:hypothetical protein